MDVARSYTSRITRLEWVFILLITLLALGLRVYRLDEIPPGLYADEAAHGLDVQEMFETGVHPIFFERNYGREPLFLYLAALAIKLMGSTAVALRVVAAVAGALTVPAVYLMLRYAFAPEGRKAPWIAGWTALFVAFSSWHLSFSRMAFRVVLVPLFACLAFAFFWRAWNSLERGGAIPWRDLILSGVFVGGSLYTYSGARMLPVLIVLVALWGGLFAARPRPTMRQAVLVVGIIGLAAVIVFLPLGVYFWNHPASFSQRAADVSVLGDEDMLSSLAHNVVQIAGMFIWTSDIALRHNPAQLPVFSPVLAACMVLGIGVALVRGRTPRYAFLLLWCFVFAVPGIVSGPQPHALRLFGMVPGVYALPVLALWEAGRLLARWKDRLRGVVAWLPLPFFCLFGVVNIQNYFLIWDKVPSLQYEFQTVFVDAAKEMSEIGDSDGVWVMPLNQFSATPAGQQLADDYRRGDWFGNVAVQTYYSMAYLYDGPGAVRVALIHPDLSAEQLTLITRGYREAYLVEWADLNHHPEGIGVGDFKNLLEFLLRKAGRLVEEEDRGDYSYRVYEAPDDPDYRIATAFELHDASFGDTVKLIGSAFGAAATSRSVSAAELDAHRVASGESVWVALQWRPEQALDHDLKVTLYLLDKAGRRAGQNDGLLVSDTYPLSNYLGEPWMPGETAHSYHILDTLPAIPPGEYRLLAGVYDPASMERFSVDAPSAIDASAFELGTIEIDRAIETPAISPQKTLSDSAWPELDIELLGFDLADRAYAPGERVSVTFYWRAYASPVTDCELAFTLHDAVGNEVFRSPPSAITAGYPTSEWASGDVWRDWQTLALPADLINDVYSLSVHLLGPDDATEDVSLQSLQIEGVPRHLEPPDGVDLTLDYHLGNVARLLASDVQPLIGSPEEVLEVTLYWQAIGPSETPYTVFVHLLDGEGRLAAGHDGMPVEGALPTDRWLPGEYITDRHRIALPADLPAGDYPVEIGMYDAATGVRLPVLDAGDAHIGDYLMLDDPVRVQ